MHCSCSTQYRISCGRSSGPPSPCAVHELHLHVLSLAVRLEDERGVEVVPRRGPDLAVGIESELRSKDGGERLSELGALGREDLQDNSEHWQPSSHYVRTTRYLLQPQETLLFLLQFVLQLELIIADCLPARTRHKLLVVRVLSGPTRTALLRLQAS
ncbi:hypothetical protein L227DRAFT_396732 [Lentinus tigrinus ALCF2SS1-6]|uniref:Uncharacterized protein n=1 Tax=Lentinus tigrinus ALCF2SS1-6 TaxID=1328759 RepID=A0A5C2RQZ5_9APHY|nr:hypothetical protein L227DRAFT_396732 [Lentinus tigrinus ALCF2SS1-6]